MSPFSTLSLRYFAIWNHLFGFSVKQSNYTTLYLILTRHFPSIPSSFRTSFYSTFEEEERIRLVINTFFSTKVKQHNPDLWRANIVEWKELVINSKTWKCSYFSHGSNSYFISYVCATRRICRLISVIRTINWSQEGEAYLLRLFNTKSCDTYNIFNFQITRV